MMAHVAFPLILSTLPKQFKNEKWPSPPIVAPPHNKKTKKPIQISPILKSGKKAIPTFSPTPLPTPPHLTSLDLTSY